jgi:hypothetical protein
MVDPSHPSDDSASREEPTMIRTVSMLSIRMFARSTILVSLAVTAALIRALMVANELSTDERADKRDGER